MSKFFKYTTLALTISGITYLVDQKLFCRFTTSEKAKLSELPFTFNSFKKLQCEFHKETGNFGSIEDIKLQNHTNSLFNYHSKKQGQLKATIVKATNSCLQNEYFTIEMTKDCKHKIKTFSNPDCLEILNLFRLEN